MIRVSLKSQILAASALGGMLLASGCGGATGDGPRRTGPPSAHGRELSPEALERVRQRFELGIDVPTESEKRAQEFRERLKSESPRLIDAKKTVKEQPSFAERLMREVEKSNPRVGGDSNGEGGKP
jgi:hypothetical protein